MIPMKKMIVCPDCGAEFKSPLMDLKFDHLGWTVPGLGVVKCPECGKDHRRNDYASA